MILKQLNSFEAACKVEGLDPKKVIPDFAAFPKEDRKSMMKHAELVIIIRAANRIANGGKKWTPDFTNRNEPKYEPRFYRGSSGFRYGVFDYWVSSSRVGSRLCFISYEAMKHVVEHPKLLKVYNEYL